MRFVLTVLFVMLPFFTFAEEVQVLFDGEIQVPRSDYKEVHFLVPELDEDSGEHTADPVEIRGRYEAIGGFNDDITMYIMDQQNYVRWFQQYKFRPELKIEKKKASDFHVTATRGETYYFVFYNFFSTVSNKKVRFKVEIVSK